MRLVAKEIFCLLLLFALFSFHLALVLDAPAGIRVMRSRAFSLPFLIFVRVHIRNTVHTVHNLDRSKLNATFERHLHDLI